jgi:O-antigen/teichoic acid export membrane protein
MRDLTRKMAKGAAWMVLARMLDRSVAFISTIILARLLVPADFGLVSLAAAILAGLELLGAFSFDMALIQNQNADRGHYDTVWTIALMFAAFFAAAMVFLSYPAARFFNEPRLSAVMQLLALGVLVGGLTNVGVVTFRKELQFDREFRLLLAKRLVLFAVTVSLAYLWRDYWALVAGTVTGMIVGVLISYLMHPYRPRLSLAKWRELFSFSRWLFVNNTLGFLYYKAADFIVAKSISTTGLGYYSVAYEISNLPSSELVMPVNRAVFPGYSRMSSDAGALRQGYLNVISMIALLAIPASIGLGCVATPLVNALLGPKWLSVVPLIPVLAIHGLLTAVMSCGNYAFLALGKPRHVTLLMSAHICMAVPMLTFGTVQWGVQGAAWALLLASVLLVPLNYLLLSATLKVKVADLIRVLWRPVTGAAVMVGILVWVQSTVDFESGVFGQIKAVLLLVTTGAVTYCATVFALWRLANRPDGAELFLSEQVARRFRPPE